MVRWGTASPATGLVRAVVGDRRGERVVAAFASFDGGPAASNLSTLSCAALGVDAVGTMLVTPLNLVPMGASGDAAAAAQELQLMSGRGPSIDACTADAPVFAPDLVADGRRERWSVFADGAVDLGLTAAFAFPLRLGAARIGAMTIYQRRPGPLPGDTAADAIVAAALVTEMILVIQASSASALSDALAGGGPWLEIHQACGMVSAQLGVGIVEAMVRLRAHAFATGRPVGDLAGDIVGRRLRLEP